MNDQENSRNDVVNVAGSISLMSKIEKLKKNQKKASTNL